MFTVGMVNYKTSDLIETQLKIYYNFAADEYKIIILDTSRDNIEYQRLLDISKNFKMSIQIIQYNPQSRGGSKAHGESLQFIYKMVDTEHFLTQDPDFFWVKPSFLVYLKNLLSKYDCVGAPYHKKYIQMLSTWSAFSDFPTAFGAAYRVSALQAINADFNPNMSKVTIKEDKIKITKDVGWQIRDNMGNRPYYSFSQEKLQIASPISSEDISCTYLDGSEKVAHHLQRCSMSMNDKNKSKHLEWQENRKKMCDFFWQEISEKAK